jgi:hypothetical protein
VAVYTWLDPPEDELRLWLRLSLVPGRTHPCTWRRPSPINIIYNIRRGAQHQVPAMGIAKHHLIHCSWSRLLCPYCLNLKLIIFSMCILRLIFSNFLFHVLLPCPKVDISAPFGLCLSSLASPASTSLSAQCLPVCCAYCLL